ncbi:MAG: hypothetical protein ACI9DM_002204 [Cyclobacteriaceae bacterium]|jgi:hypothetical protein
MNKSAPVYQDAFFIRKARGVVANHKDGIVLKDTRVAFVPNFHFQFTLVTYNKFTGRPEGGENFIGLN